MMNAPRTLPTFRVPSSQPPAFHGSAKYKPAHLAQQSIDEYLHKAAKVAKIHGFRADGAPALFLEHPTYVQWISTGLTGMALTYWLQLPEATQDNMTWDVYKAWIQRHFTSALTLQDATRTLQALKQRKSASQYSQQFNELVEAIRSKGVNMYDKYLCILYRDGLKDFLIKENKLYDINDDLKKFQEATERLDDHHWRTTNGSRRSNTNRNQQAPKGSNSNSQRDDPMDLDNIRQHPNQQQQFSEAHGQGESLLPGKGVVHLLQIKGACLCRVPAPQQKACQFKQIDRKT
jgi:hypothetical protein